jgi:hypothetical protein
LFDWLAKRRVYWQFGLGCVLGRSYKPSDKLPVVCGCLVAWFYKSLGFQVAVESDLVSLHGLFEGWVYEFEWASKYHGWVWQSRVLDDLYDFILVGSSAGQNWRGFLWVNPKWADGERFIEL